MNTTEILSELDKIILECKYSAEAFGRMGLYTEEISSNAMAFAYAHAKKLILQHDQIPNPPTIPQPRQDKP